MLTLIKGRAGTGKTSLIFKEIKRKGDSGDKKLLLIIPEQYSHDAERQLCEICGDKLSLYAEVLTFSRLSARALFEVGTAPPNLVDKSGLVLILYRALESVAAELNVFGAKWLRTDLLEKLLDTIIELKSSGITSKRLVSMAELLPEQLGNKLGDLALILDAYDRFLHERGNDSEDMLSLLAVNIAQGAAEGICQVYIDGFNDFTGGEIRIIEELLKRDVNLTICLTCDDINSDNDSFGYDGTNEAFFLPRDTEARLKAFADNYKIEMRCKIIKTIAANKAPELVFLEKHLFSNDTPVYSAEDNAEYKTEYNAQRNAITVYSMPTQYTECEQAAAKVRQLVRSGYRWREIAVMARNWETYAGICESVFDRYGIKYFSSGRTSVIDKPPIAIIEAALDVVVSGWEYKTVFKYLKTGLARLNPDECAVLENYVLKWGIRSSQWKREWTLPPDVSVNKCRNAEEETLIKLNILRCRVNEPIVRLSEGIKRETEAKVKIKALYAFLEEINLPSQLAEKAAKLEERGELRLAGEYEQIWDVIVDAMEQMLSIMDDSTISAAEFRKLFMLTISHYSVSVIPVSLDRTALGGMSMSRRRDLKCLIILGATDENMPMQAKAHGALNDNEREQISKLDKNISSGFIERLNKEMNMIYSTVTLPSQELIITYPAQGTNRPSFLINRIKAMFSTVAVTPGEDEYMSQAEGPCFELAIQFGKTKESVAALAARRYFTELSSDNAQYLCDFDILLHEGRGVLSRQRAQSLYGMTPLLSPTGVDNYYSCAYRHFLQSGLRLKQRVAREFDAPAAGVFIHRILENVCSEIKNTVGYKNAGNELTRKLIKQSADKYISEEMHDFEGKDARFIYLFRRMEENAAAIVEDLLSELKNSDFEPFGFEIPFRDISENVNTTAEPASFEKPDVFDGGAEYRESNTTGEPAITGYIDRVDVWNNNGKRYVRVIDYKTGKKTFLLSDVYCGKDMQMLIYLYELVKTAPFAFGSGMQIGTPSEDEMIPAGVLYFPARDIVVDTARNTSEEELKRMREKELRRKGLVLSDPAVIEAMENGEQKKYLPIGINKSGEFTGDSLIGFSELKLLLRYVGHKLNEAMHNILEGDIKCEPYRSTRENACAFCQFHCVCGFDEGLGDRRRYHRNMKVAEFWNAISK